MYWTNVNWKYLYLMIPSGYISYYQPTSGTGPVSKMTCFLNHTRQQAISNTCITLTFSVYSQHEISWNPFQNFRNYKHRWSVIICSFLYTKNTYEKGLCHIFVLIYLYINTLLITEQFHKYDDKWLVGIGRTNHDLTECLLQKFRGVSEETSKYLQYQISVL